MDVQVEKTGPYNCKISVKVPAADVDRAFDDVHKKYSKNAKIPGFRPGKAPRSVIDMHFREEMQNEVENSLVGDTLSKAIVEHKVDAVARPRVETGELKRGVEFAYTAEIEVRPEIKLEKWSGLEVPNFEIEVQDAEIDNELESMRAQSAQLVPVMIRDIAEKGDLLLCDFQGFIGGAPLRGGKGENAIIEIGGEGYIPGFAEQLEGAKVPSERTIAVTFPTDYSVADLKGKDATFNVKVKEIKRKELPKLDDDFAKDVGEDSLQALKDKIRANITTTRERDRKHEEREAALKALVAANHFEVPPSMIAEQADRMIVDAATRVQQIMGPQFDLNQLDIEALRRDNRPRAEHQVRAGLLLIEVSKSEKLEVDAAAIQTEIERMVTEAGAEGERVRAHFNAPEERQRLSYRLLEDKTLEHILSKAKRENTIKVGADKPAPDDGGHAHGDHDHDHDHAHGHDHDHDHDHGHDHSGHGHR